MNEKQLALAKVQKAMAENTKQIKAFTLNAIVCETSIKSLKKQMIKLEKIYKDRINKTQLLVDKSIKNAKFSHDRVDHFLKEKESLFLEFKEAIHFGKEQCEWCKNYFTPTGLPRHKSACASKPVNKIVKKHKAEIDKTTDDIEVRKEALKKQLAELEK